MLELRINNPAAIDREQIENVIAQRSKVIVQFSEASYTRQMLTQLNALCAEWGRKVEVRFYSHHASRFDASVVRFIPDVEALSIDCLIEAENLEALKDLKHLVEFSLGVYRLDDSQFLAEVPIASVERLVISETAKKNLDLKPLERCGRLGELYVVGHTRGINSIASLKGLRSLSLAHISNKQDLGFVSSIEGLKELRILLGGRRNIEEIRNSSIERLEIVRVRGFESLDNLRWFSSLQELTIEDQIQLKQIAFTSDNSSLRTVKLLNCKSLEAVRGLSELKNLGHLRIYKTSVDLDRILTSGLPKNLSIFAMYTGKVREDERIRQRLKSMGYNDGLQLS